jgi:hypothetical protein
MCQLPGEGLTAGPRHVQAQREPANLLRADRQLGVKLAHVARGRRDGNHALPTLLTIPVAIQRLTHVLHTAELQGAQSTGTGAPRGYRGAGPGGRLPIRNQRTGAKWLVALR